MARSAKSWARRSNALKAPPVHDERPSASRRGYDRRWRREASAYLQVHPMCIDCLADGKLVAAREVHHIVRVSARPDLKHDWSNLMALCKSCHSRRTTRGE